MYPGNISFPSPKRRPSPNRTNRKSMSNGPPWLGLITIAERISTLRVCGVCRGVEFAFPFFHYVDAKAPGIRRIRFRPAPMIPVASSFGAS